MYIYTQSYLIRCIFTAYLINNFSYMRNNIIDSTIIIILCISYRYRLLYSCLRNDVHSIL